MSAPTTAWCQVSGLSDARADAPPHEHTHVQPGWRPTATRVTLGWWWARSVRGRAPCARSAVLRGLLPGMLLGLLLGMLLGLLVAVLVMISGVALIAVSSCVAGSSGAELDDPPTGRVRLCRRRHSGRVRPHLTYRMGEA